MNQCQAKNSGYSRGRCMAAARVEIEKQRFCVKHAQQQALAVLFKLKKAKDIWQPPAPRDITKPIEIYNEEEKDEEGE